MSLTTARAHCTRDIQLAIAHQVREEPINSCTNQNDPALSSVHRPCISILTANCQPRLHYLQPHAARRVVISRRRLTAPTIFHDLCSFRSRKVLARTPCNYYFATAPIVRLYINHPSDPSPTAIPLTVATRLDPSTNLYSSSSIERTH